MQTKQSEVRLCQSCQLLVDVNELDADHSAYCPRCDTQLYHGRHIQLSANLAIAIACLIALYPAIFFPFITIRLLGEAISASLWDGIVLLHKEGFNSISLLVGFTTIVTPCVVIIATFVSHYALKHRNQSLLKIAQSTFQHLKHWMMLDVFLISIAISSFKLQDYADLHFQKGLLFLVIFQLLVLLLISRVNARRYWDQFSRFTQVSSGSGHFSAYPKMATQQKSSFVDCPHCCLTQPNTQYCIRCHSKVSYDENKLLSMTWLYLFIAIIAIIPANVIPISVFITNGQQLEDTILSGVASLVETDMLGIALIIFVASVMVPICKILGIAYLLLSIQFDRQRYYNSRMKLYFFVKWIGKWSMMDILVIAIMLTLIDRGQLLDFTPGYGAIAFGIVVVFTMLAAETLKPHLIWRSLNSKE